MSASKDMSFCDVSRQSTLRMPEKQLESYFTGMFPFPPQLPAWLQTLVGPDPSDLRSLCPKGFWIFLMLKLWNFSFSLHKHKTYQTTCNIPTSSAHVCSIKNNDINRPPLQCFFPLKLQRFTQFPVWGVLYFLSFKRTKGRVAMEALINKEINNFYCKADISVGLWLPCKLGDPS